jgi:hypothetical protein
MLLKGLSLLKLLIDMFKIFVFVKNWFFKLNLNQKIFFFVFIAFSLGGTGSFAYLKYYNLYNKNIHAFSSYSILQLLKERHTDIILNCPSDTMVLSIFLLEYNKKLKLYQYIPATVLLKHNNQLLNRAKFFASTDGLLNEFTSKNLQTFFEGYNLFSMSDTINKKFQIHSYKQILKFVLDNPYIWSTIPANNLDDRKIHSYFIKDRTGNIVIVILLSSMYNDYNILEKVKNSETCRNATKYTNMHNGVKELLQGIVNQDIYNIKMYL